MVEDDEAIHGNQIFLKNNTQIQKGKNQTLKKYEQLHLIIKSRTKFNSIKTLLKPNQNKKLEREKKKVKPHSLPNQWPHGNANCEKECGSKSHFYKLHLKDRLLKNP